MHFAFWVLDFGVCAQKFSVRGRGTATSLCICACVTYSKVPNNRAANLITVKLGNKERFDKEQIGNKEPFPVTNLTFTS